MGTGAKLRSAGGLRALRGALARRFLLKLKRATHRSQPELIVPAARRVLVVAPHMDDEVIPCGGTLILLADTGAEIHVAFATDSSGALPSAEARAALTRTRRAEAKKVSKQVGFTFTELAFPDGQLHRNENEVSNALTKLIEQLDPDCIFCPFPGDAHSDHMSCAAALAHAASTARSGATIFAYEVWTPSWPNVAVDISRVADRKERAIRLYRSQIADRDHAAAALGLNRFRGLPHSVAFAEAFYRANPSEFGRIADLLNRI